MKLLTTQLLLWILSSYLTLEISSQSCSSSKACDTTACCSQWGNCGFGPDFCGSGNCINTCGAKPECGQFADNHNCPLKVCCSQWGFCGTTADFCQSNCQNNCASPPPQFCPTADVGAQLNVGYYASWSATRKCNPFTIDNIDPRNYTHLNYAFGAISGGVLIVASSQEEADLQKFASLKKIAPNLKVMVSVGGWAFNDPGPTQSEFHNIIANTGSRSKFISSVNDYLQAHNLDGIDIDYEYPAADDRGGSPSDTDNYLALVKEMRVAFGSKYLITIAAPASYWYLRHFKIGEMSNYLDWINVMSYDIHGVWDADIDSLGPQVKSHTNIVEIKQAIELFLRDGVPSHKLVLGLGLYGRGFTLGDPSCTQIGCPFISGNTAGPCTVSEGTLALFEIEDIIAQNSVSLVYDEASQSKIMVWGGNQWIAYDDDETLAIKREYARSSCMAGVMLWSIDQGSSKVDDERPLLRSGSLQYNLISLYVLQFIFNDSPVQIRIRLDSTRDAIDGYNADSVTLYTTSSTTTVPSPTYPAPMATPTPVEPFCYADDVDRLGITDALIQIQEDLAAERIISQITVGSVINHEVENEPGNPVNNYFERLIDDSGAQGGDSVWRPEFIFATIEPRHVGVPRTNFPRTTEFANQMSNLGARRYDERGHLVGSQFSGPLELYNMVPQDRSVNRNYHSSRDAGNDWYLTELLMAAHFDDYPQGHIDWRVFVGYNDTDTELVGRPSQFLWSAILYDSSGNIVDYIEGNARNEFH